MIRLGLVGCGRLGKKHLEAYENIQNVEIVAVCDVNSEDLFSVAKEYEIEDAYKNYRDLVLNAEINAVDVCTPTALHHKIILTALEKGLDVFCEKPLTYRADFAEMIKESSEKNKKHVVVGYLYRFHPTMRRLKEILEDEILGDVSYAMFRVGGRGGHKPWKHEKQTGGAMLETLVHSLDLAFYNFDDFVSSELLFSDTIVKERTIEDKRYTISGEDFVLLKLETKDGIQVFCQGDQITPSYMNIVEVHGGNGSFFGSILEDLPTVVFCKKGRGQYFEGKNLFVEPEINLMRKELQFFVDVLEEKKELHSDSVTNSIKILKTIEEAQKFERER